MSTGWTLRSLMADATTTLANDLADHAVNDQTVYLALYSDASTELTATGYARQAVSFGAADAGIARNDTTLEFPAFTGAGGSITHAALWSAASGGTRLTAIKALGGTSLTWVDSIPVVFPTGTITFTVA